MEQNESLQIGNGFMPPDKIMLMINIMLTKKYGNYQTVVNQLKNIYIGEDNIEEVQNLLKNVNSFMNSVEDHRKDMKDPYLNYGRIIDNAHKDFLAPFLEEKDKVQQKLNAVAKAKAERIARENAEKVRQANITSLINQFILDYSVKIASATTNEQLLSIERLINLEKAQKNKYDNQLPLLIERCNELNEKIKHQKELIRHREALENEKKQAEDNGDDKKLNELEEKTSEIDSKIQDNTILVQEMASNNMITPDNLENSLLNAPKARRVVWKVEIYDEKEAIKKSKDMLDISLNPEKARQSINTLKAAGVFNGKKEVVINGIRYFEESTF